MEDFKKVATFCLMLSVGEELQRVENFGMQLIQASGPKYPNPHEKKLI